MSDRTWTASVAGTYHFSAFGDPHLVAECSPACTSYLELPEGATVVSFDAAPAEYVPGEMPGLIKAPRDMTPEQVAEFQAAWDEMMRDLPTRPAVWRSEPRKWEYPTGSGRLRNSLTGEVGPNPYEEADRQHGYPEVGGDGD